jgi:ATP-dependent protease HslVU (ClpYQ) peptidase subunit
MSCVVGIFDKNSVIIGGDSAVVEAKSTIQTDMSPKVFRLHTQQGEYLIGHTGSGRLGNVLRHAFTPPPFERRSGSLEEYIVTHFIDALRESLKRAGFAKVENGAERVGGGKMLVGFRGQLFWIEDDYQVGQPMQGYAAIGSGETYALGAFYSLQAIEHALTPEDQVRLALEAAAEHNTCVRPPFIIIENTEGDAF